MLETDIFKLGVKIGRMEVQYEKMFEQLAMYEIKLNQMRDRLNELIKENEQEIPND
jgi:hypothetical protein